MNGEGMDGKARSDESHRTNHDNGWSRRGYIRFSRRSALRHKGERPDISETKIDSAELSRAIYGVDRDRFSSWEEFCSWCLAVGRAEEAVVFLEDGAVLAADGDLSPPALQDLASYLSDLLARTPPSSTGRETVDSVAVSLGGSWLTALQIEPETSNSARISPRTCVGIHGAEPLFHDVRHAMISQARFILRNL